MAHPPAVYPTWQRALILLSGTTVAVLLTVTLYWARVILIPLALAVFFSFILAPFVRMLVRRRVPRGAAVIFTVGIASSIVLVTAWVLVQQLTSLTMSLPDYHEQIIRKVSDAKAWMGVGDGGSAKRLTWLFQEIERVLNPKPPEQPDGIENGATIKVDTSPPWLNSLNHFISPALEMVGQFAFAFILVIFFLFRKEDLRDRLIRLIGDGHVTKTTKALDDASTRVSRYLLKQFLFNSAFGIVVTLGLVAMNVRFALLWGFLVAVMRYLPYLGTWVSVFFPTGYTFAVYDTLWQPIGVLTLILGLEIVCNNFIEPFLYGSSLGVSEVAQLIAAGFWSFLWGPIGLILSGPLTTCLLVLGKHIPALKFLEIMLGDDPPLTPGMMFYQRVTGRDEDDAARILRDSITASSRNDSYDQVIIPALIRIKSAELDADLTPQAAEQSLVAIREIVDTRLSDPQIIEQPANPDARRRILVVTAKDEVDALACELFADLIPNEKWVASVVGAAKLTGELSDSIPAINPSMVIIGSLPPGGVTHCRYVCKRLRSRFPDLKLIVARWGDSNQEDSLDAAEFGADALTYSYAETLTLLAGWLPVVSGPSDRGLDVPMRDNKLNPEIVAV
jgi:predicted PurR-regulated permease PerM